MTEAFDMRFSNLLKTGTAVCIGLLLLFSYEVLSRQLVIHDITIDEEEECALIQVDFNFPVRYVNHFPYEAGKDLRIRLRPIAIGPEIRDAVFSRETRPLPPNDVASLLEVIYEGNIVGGPYLSLFFRRSMVSKVKQGADFRSLAIVVQGAGPSKPCSFSP